MFTAVSEPESNLEADYLPWTLVLVFQPAGMQGSLLQAGWKQLVPNAHQCGDDSLSICKPNACTGIWDVAALLLLGSGMLDRVSREGQINKLKLSERKLLLSTTNLLFSGFFLGGVEFK